MSAGAASSRAPASGSPAGRVERVFITGASSGIGAALAASYARRGASVALIGRRRDALEALARALPGDHTVYALDVRDREALHRAACDFLRGGAVDVVIACAGISIGTQTEFPEDFEVFRAIHDTNLLATVATFEPFVEGMKARGRGRLVGVASVAGVRGLPGAGAYSASKAAVRAYCESLRVELHGSGVRVVTILPGFIRTPMTADNPYRMPFLMPVADFAETAIRHIQRGSRSVVIPWQMGMVAALLHAVPGWLYDRVAARRKRKPRQHTR